MKTICILVILSAFIFGCNLNSKNQPKQNTPAGSVPYDEKTDSVVQSLIERLPEFKILDARFKKKLDLSHHLTLFTTQRPDSSFKFYWVQAGDDNPDRFEPWYNFYVNLKDSTVLFYDTVSDSILTMQQWRKSGKDNLLHQ